MLSRIGQLLEQLPGVGVAPIVGGVELEEKVPELPLEMVEESGVVSGSLQAHGFQAKGHGDRIEVRLSLDYEAQTRGHALPEIFRQLCRSNVGGHGSHTLGDPPHNVLPEISATQRVSIITVIVATIIFDFILILIIIDGAVAVWSIEFSTASSASCCVCTRDDTSTRA